MPRFSLRTLFLSVTLIAAGVGGVILPFNAVPPLDPLKATLGLISFGLIGAGIGVLFQRAGAGFVVAILLVVILSVVILPQFMWLE